MSEARKHVLRTGHPFYLYESIIHTPEALEACLSGSVWDQIQQVARKIEQRGVERVILSGTGSSYYAALASGYAFRQLAHMPVQVGITSELGAYPPLNLNRHDAWLFISHSGGTVGDEPIVRMAQQQGVLTIGVTDVPDSRLAGLVDEVLIGPGGPKPELPATRTYSSAVLRMMLLAAEASCVGAAGEGSPEFLKAARRLPEQLKQVIAGTEETIQMLIDTFLPCRYFVFLGSGPNIATAHEGALGFSQSLDAQAQGFILEEWLHGPIQTLSQDMGVVVIASESPRQQRMLDVIRAVRVLGARSLAIGPEGLGGLGEADTAICLPKTLDLLSPLLAISPLWQMGYRFALKTGRNPDRLSMDQPRFQNAMDLLMGSDVKFTGQRDL
ncbi:MAG: SIS domain-containing protein [Anaerolineales bacterium]|nr:SIS domain-containing protein [Anaerolineales bacterium]